MIPGNQADATRRRQAVDIHLLRADSYLTALQHLSHDAEQGDGLTGQDVYFLLEPLRRELDGVRQAFYSKEELAALSG